MEREILASLVDFERLPVAGGVFEVDGTILALNAAARRLLACDESALGRKLWEFAPGLDLSWDAIARSPSYTGEIVLAAAGTTRTVELVTARRAALDRTVVIGFATDISHHKREQEAARENVQAVQREAASQRLESLGLVAGGIAHEFNNLLVSVVAEAGVAREDEALAEPTREALGRIEASAKRMTHLTRQLLAYAGRGRFVTSLLDPDALLAELGAALAKRAPSNVKLEVAVAAGAVAIEADRALLRQVIRELVENATEAVRDRGTIALASRIVTEHGRPWWELEIHDDGTGMDPTTLARIFDPFFTTKTDRRGLGLSAVLGVVRRLGGDLAVRSVPRLGTTFRVRLPVVPGVAPPRRRSTSEQTKFESLIGLRILIADDEPTVRATVRRLLERRGAQPVLAADGKEAEQLLRTERFDFVLLDVLMPGRTGYELIPIAREHQPGIPVVLMSGYSEQARGVELPDGFIEKPFTAGTLEAAIQEALKSEPVGNGEL